jgi:formylmethanofuran dehydrogenase subunit C
MHRNKTILAFFLTIFLFVSGSKWVFGCGEVVCHDGYPTGWCSIPDPCKAPEIQRPEYQKVDLEIIPNKCDGYIQINGTEENCIPKNKCDGLVVIYGTKETCVPDKKCDGFVRINGADAECIPDEKCDGLVEFKGAQKYCVPEDQCDGFVKIEGANKQCIPDAKDTKGVKSDIQSSGDDKNQLSEDSPRIMSEEEAKALMAEIAKEKGLETPLIDPIDILTMFEGGFLKSLFKSGGELAGETAEKVAYYYFKNTSGEVADLIAKDGIKVSTGFSSTKGYEGKVFLSEIAPDKISKTNLFAYGVSDADYVAKIAVKEADLGIPAQTFYYGEKGARFVKDGSGLYVAGENGAKYLNPSAIDSVSSLAPYQGNINSFWNNIADVPRCLTRYWLSGGLWGYTGYNYFGKK